jgi:hypothetical protein
MLLISMSGIFLFHKDTQSTTKFHRASLRLCASAVKKPLIKNKPPAFYLTVD